MVALGHQVVRVPRSRALVPIVPVEAVNSLVWGAGHPVLGDILVKPTPEGYEIVGACDTCKMRVVINMRFGDDKEVALTAKEALSRALNGYHPAPPEKFAANLAEVRRIYGERISAEVGK